MRFLWAATLKDLRRRRRDPLAVLLWVGIPLVIALLLQLAFGGAGPAVRVELLVADNDGTFVSGLLPGALGQGPLGELFLVESVSEADGRARLEGGDGSALLVIPAGFARAVLDEQPFALELLTNPAERIRPGIAREVLATLVDAAGYLQRLLGSTMRSYAAGPLPGAATLADSLVVANSLRINRVIERLSPFLLPPAIRLEMVSIDGAGDEAVRATSAGFGRIFFPSMLFLGLLFIAQGLADDVWEEHASGTLRRTAVSPQPLAALLGGKLAAAALLFALVSLFAYLVGRSFFGVPLANLGLAVLWSALFGTGMLLVLTMLQLFASSRRAGSLISMVIIFPLAMLGGSFFPFEMMSPALVALGRWTPNGWALLRLRSILDGSLAAAPFLTGLAGLLVFGAVCFLVAVRRLRRAFLES